MPRRDHIEMSLALLAALFLIAGFVLDRVGVSVYVWGVFTLLAAICSSTRTFPEALGSLRQLKLDIDVLMFAAAGGATILGHAHEGALLLVLFGLGSAGESLALGRAERAIGALTQLAPRQATRILSGGVEETVLVESLNPGDRIRIRAFERIPADARIEEGNSDIDESSMTGESIPVNKSPGEEIFAGTLNGGGALLASVLRPTGETRLARIVQIVESARTLRSPTQQLTERVERWYVPLVMLVTVILCFAPPLLGIEPRRSFESSIGSSSIGSSSSAVDSAVESGGAVRSVGSRWGGWFYQAMAFLTAASPCALAIGTPAAVLCGIARSARMGVLIKGGATLELIGRIKAVALDKTGTLTEGKPTLALLRAAPDISIDRLLLLTAAVEMHASHPLAHAVVEAYRSASSASARSDLPPAMEITQTPGIGIEARVDGHQVWIGKPSVISDAWPEELERARQEGERAGMSLVAVRIDGRLAGLLGFADPARASARALIDQLREREIDPIVMLTGDHVRAADHIAKQVGIDRVYAGLSPEDKLDLIERIRAESGEVLMVGDGVNDAPALARASVGAAIGMRSTRASSVSSVSEGVQATQEKTTHAADVALETADLVLMQSDLRRLPETIDLSRRSRTIIAQNLVIALGVIAIVAPLAALGFAPLGLAVLLHEGSTIVVVLNALRLLR